jgi:hypothetical protein
MLDFLKLRVHVFAAPFRTQAQLEAEITVLPQQGLGLGAKPGESANGRDRPMSRSAPLLSANSFFESSENVAEDGPHLKRGPPQAR